MNIEQALANALDDLSLEPLEGGADVLESSLTSGYSMPEVGASPCSSSVCCCSLGSCSS
jgi:hypothetical protein